MWNIVRGVIVLIERRFVGANPIPQTCAGPCTGGIGPSHLEQPEVSGGLARRAGASQRDRPVLHECHRARHPESWRDGDCQNRPVYWRSGQ